MYIVRCWYNTLHQVVITYRWIT